MKNRIASTILIALVAVLVVNILCVFKQLWLPFERRIYDIKYQYILNHERIEEVVVVDIDEKTLEKLGRYQNWPRAFFAEVVEYLAPAAVVGLDVFFGEPDTLSVYSQRYYSKPNFDSLFERALSQHRRVVLASAEAKKPLFTRNNEVGVGLIFPDDDGIVRRAFVTVGDDTTFAAAVALMVDPPELAHRFLIRFFDESSFRRISFSDVYLARVPREYFTDKIVLVGGTAEGLFDFLSVPFDRHFPGIMVQANIIYNFIKGIKVYEIPYYYTLMLTLVLALCCAFSIATRPVKTYVAIIVILLIVCALVSLVLFVQGIEMGIVRPVYSLVLVTIGSLIYRYRFEEREKRRIKSIFSRYYSEELVEKVILSPPQLGGEKVDCTVMFADIRNFTPYTEQNDPEQVGARLNNFLDTMVQIIFKYEGRVDKFIGDCVMAVFGSPVAVENHALNACRAAKAMVKEAYKLGFKIGIGINSGEVISGNFGSPMRMEFTVIGDTVNLASRLEGVTKQFDCSIIIGPETYARACKDHTPDIEFKAMGNVSVKGKKEEIPVYTVQASKDEKS